MLAFYYLLLDCVAAYEAIDHHRFLLANSVGPVHCLLVLLRVEVAVVDDHCVCSSKGDAQAAGSRGEHEDEDIRVGFLKRSYLRFAVLELGGAVEATKLVLAVVAVVLKDIEEGGELREDENLVLLCEELFEEHVQDLEFSRILNEVFAERRESGVLSLGEHVKMQANLAQMDQPVLQGSRVAI